MEDPRKIFEAVNLFLDDKQKTGWIIFLTKLLLHGVEK